MYWIVYYQEESGIIDECAITNWLRIMTGGKNGGAYALRILVLYVNLSLKATFVLRSEKRWPARMEGGGLWRREVLKIGEG